MKKNYGRTIRILLCLAFVGGIFLAAAGIYSALVDKLPAAAGEIVLGAAIIIQSFVVYAKREKEEKEYMNILTGNQQITSGNVLRFFPMPICVLHIAGDIVWFNEKMSEMLKINDLYGVKLEKVMPSIKWGSVIKSGKIDRTAEHNGHQYHVFGRIITASEREDDDKEKYTVYLYFVDKTREVEITRKYLEERYDVALISIDNYDYVLQKTDDSEGQDILYKTGQFIGAWVKESGGILKKTDRDKYFALFEHKYLDMYIEKRFDLLGKVRELSEQVNIPFSITLGIGTGGSITENEAGARTALDLAIGRGGDMVAVKEPAQYRFYASKMKEYDKSTKAKARAGALAIKSFIKGVERVVIVGHSGADFDCFGAAMGLQRAVRCLGKKPYIVCDNMAAVEKLYKRVREVPDYEGMLIAKDRALELTDHQTLLIIVDTHRPALLPERELLTRTDKIVLIDHHRRSTDFISPLSLTHHEPYASSTCEMVTELLQYMNVGDNLTSLEVQCLYMGILMDTKNFIVKTGVRTFEAASYLRRRGLDTVAVKQMFAVDKDEYDERAEIVMSMERVFDNIGISVCREQYDNVRVIASQAADDMMNIDNIEASFVIYPLDNGVCISGRSLGDINVQEILEQLGGGGHSTVAGAQLRNKSFDNVREELIRAVGVYLAGSEERGNKE